MQKTLLIVLGGILFFGCAKTTLSVSNKESLRVISAAPSITEIISALDMADSLIAVDKYSKDVEGINAELPEIDFFFPDIEAIASLRPDIIISGEINTGGGAGTPFDFFLRFGIRVIQIPTSGSVMEIYEDIIKIATALDVKERGEALVLQIQTRIETIRAASSAIISTEKKSVYFEIAPAPIIVSFGGGTYLNELIEIAGGQNIFSAEQRWFTPGAEAIIQANPDIIFILADENDAGNYINEIKNRPGFQSISAVRNNRIFPIKENIASRPSQNIALALELMRQKIYY